MGRHSEQQDILKAYDAIAILGILEHNILVIVESPTVGCSQI